MLNIKQFIEAIRQRMIGDIKYFFHFASVRIDLFGVAFGSYFLAFPNVAYDIWNNFPPDLKTLIPAQWAQAFSVGLLVLSLFARAYKQRTLEQKKNESQRIDQNQ